MDAFIKGIVIFVAAIGLTKCQDSFNFNILATSPLPESKLMKNTTGIRNVIECARMCSFASSCDFLQYCTERGECALYGENATGTTVFDKCSNGKPPITVKRIQSALPASSSTPSGCDFNKYLVTGPDGVADSQLSESSFFCNNNPTWCPGVPDGLSAKYARLNRTGEYSCWTQAEPLGVTEHIQVDFLTTRLTTGVVLTGRAVPIYGNYQYVTAFKVLYSLDCATFTHVQDDSGTDKTFSGCSSAQEVVTQMFEHPISARCIRINPTLWWNFPSLRFDVLGC